MPYPCLGGGPSSLESLPSSLGDFVEMKRATGQPKVSCFDPSPSQCPYAVCARWVFGAVPVVEDC